MSNALHEDFCPTRVRNDMQHDPFLKECIATYEINPATLESEMHKHPGYMQYYTSKHLEAIATLAQEKRTLQQCEAMANDLYRSRRKLTEKQLEHALNQDSRIIEQRQRRDAARLYVEYWKSQIERGKEKLTIMTTIAHDNRVDKKFIDPTRYVGTSMHRDAFVHQMEAQRGKNASPNGHR